MKYLMTVMVVFLSGCIPIAGHYYEPMAENAVQFRQGCHTGAKSGIEFIRDNVKIFVQSMYRPDKDSYLLLDVKFLLTSEDKVSVQWSDMKISESDGTIIQFAPDRNMYAYNLPLAIADLENARVPNLDKMEGSKFSHYVIELNVSKQPLTEFMFELPSMTINGKTYPATTIHYTEKFGAWVIPINC